MQINNVNQTVFGGTETLSTLADLINSASAKATPVDADTIPITDSAASNAIKRTTWANIKATLKTYFDTLYQAVLVSGTNIKTINSNSILGSGDLVISGSGGGSVDISGIPTAGQVVRWVDADTIEGVTALGISDLSSKTTPVDADETVIRDSADSGNGKKLSWSNIKATLKTYFDTLYNVSTLNDQSSAYTLVLADAGKTIRHPASDNNARTFTIPANSSVAYPVGTVVTFINEVNTVTIAITSDTLVWGDGDTGGTGSRTLPAHGMATAIKVSSTRWYISGSGLS